jgi:hypothetical protein
MAKTGILTNTCGQVKTRRTARFAVHRRDAVGAVRVQHPRPCTRPCICLAAEALLTSAASIVPRTIWAFDNIKNQAARLNLIGAP